MALGLHWTAFAGMKRPLVHVASFRTPLMVQLPCCETWGWLASRGSRVRISAGRVYCMCLAASTMQKSLLRLYSLPYG